MEVIEKQRETALGLLKSKTENEFLVKIGAKEEEFDWDPKIVNEPLHRSTSFVCSEYQKPSCYRSKPKSVSVDPWRCSDPACRQLTRVGRFGPKNFYMNNQNIHEKEKEYLNGASIRAAGLCFEPKSVSSL